MRSRFFGASSYDDEDEYDNEEEPMDMSGFIGSTTVEQPPIVVERKRASRETPPAPSTGDSGMGNAGPRSVPPPTSNIGWTPPFVANATDNKSASWTGGTNGSPFNPLWADDETLGPNWLPVISKCSGLAMLFAGGTGSVFTKGVAGGSGKMMLVGGVLYAMPVMGMYRGVVANAMGNPSGWGWKSAGNHAYALAFWPVVGVVTKKLKLW